jgi:hypothetical protein
MTAQLKITHEEFSQVRVELRGLEPLTPACQERPSSRLTCLPQVNADLGARERL